MPLRITRRGSQSGWAIALNSILLMILALRLELWFPRVDIMTGEGDKQWHHETVTLEDAVLRHGGTKGSDLALVNTDRRDW
jgi:hypothetical protein